MICNGEDHLHQYHNIVTENLASDTGIELTMAFVTCAERSSDSSPQSNFLKFLKTAIEETLTIEAN